METAINRLRTSSLNLISVTKLYDKLNELLVPLFAGRRMRLPCLTFKLGRVSPSRDGSEHIFRSQTSALGVAEIRTEEDLSRLGSLYLIHPWTDFLLDRQPVGNITEVAPQEKTDDRSSVLSELSSLPGPSAITSTTLPTRAARLITRLGLPFTGLPNTSSRDTVSLPPPSSVSPMEKEIRALRFIARLRQPFGALLFTPIRRHVQEYRRIAAESLITVQVEEITHVILDKLMDAVRTLDVL